MENKVISLLGVDYTEEKIQVLINYINHMEDAVGAFDRKNESIIEYMIKSQQASDKYLVNQSKEDTELLEHFANARNKLDNSSPIIKLLMNTFIVLAYGTVSATVPPVLNLSICAILAKFVTDNIKKAIDKNAYNKIIKIVKENLN